MDTDTAARPSPSPPSSHRLWAGLAIVVAIACSWVGATQYTQYALSSHAGFRAPLFSVYFSTSFLLLLFPAACIDALAQRKKPPTHERSLLLPDAWASTSKRMVESSAPTFVSSALADLLQFHNLGPYTPYSTFHSSGSTEGAVVEGHGNSSVGVSALIESADEAHVQTASRPPLTLQQRFFRTWVGLVPGQPPTLGHACLLALPFLGLWLGANYCYSRALMYVAASDVTAVFAATPALVYCLSIVALDEPVVWHRVLSVAGTVAGVVLVAMAEHLAHLNLAGVAFTLGASLCSASYKVLLKVYAGSAGAPAVSLFLSLLALLNVLLVWPIWFALRETGAESFSFEEAPWVPLCISAILTLLCNFLINFGVTYTYPLFISIGTLLGTPINVVVDWQVHGLVPHWMTLLGCALVAAAFLLLLLSGGGGQRREQIFTVARR